MNISTSKREAVEMVEKHSIVLEIPTILELALSCTDR